MVVEEESKIRFPVKLFMSDSDELGLFLHYTRSLLTLLGLF
jgi:hypothetical protein